MEDAKERTQTQDSQILQCEQLKRKKTDVIPREVELQHMSFLARVHDRFRPLERTYTGVGSRFCIYA